jgi:hypothetical protein
MNVSDDDINIYWGDFPELTTWHGFGMRGDHDITSLSRTKVGKCFNGGRSWLGCEKVGNYQRVDEGVEE